MEALPAGTHGEHSAPAFGLEALEGRALAAGLAGAYFARTNLTLARYSQADSLIDLAWPSGTPNTALGLDGFSVRWTGQVLGKFSETHTFTTVSTGGVRLWVNNFLIIDAWQNHALREDQGSLRLSAGKWFDIRLEYWSDGNNPQIELDWQSTRLPRMVVPTDRLQAAVLDAVPPTAPGRLRGSNSSSNSITLVWDAATDPSGVVAYDVYVGSTRVAGTLPNQLAYTRNNLPPSTGYVFSVQAIDAAGNGSPLATTALATAAPSNLPPSTPANVHVVGLGRAFVSLAWNASTDDFGVTGYRVYRNGVKLNIAPTGPNFIDNTVQPNTTYTYTIRAADGGGLFSAFSQAVQATTPPAANPFDGLSATDYDSASGVSSSGSTLTGLDNGDWIRFEDLAFDAGANSVAFELALDPNTRGGSIELHLDSVDGTLIARHLVQPTGASNTFQTQRLNVTGATGTHDLYIVFKDHSDIARLKTIKFSTTHLMRIMPLGDSITESTADPLNPTYRYYLWHKLLDAGITNIDFVGSRTKSQFDVNPFTYDLDQNHEGHSGWTADQIAAKAATFASQSMPDVVLVHIGTNDLYQGQSVATTVDDIEDIIDNLRDVLPNVTILLAKILPLVNHLSDVDLLNEGIAGLVGEKDTAQSRLILVDLNTGITLDEMVDGIHPKPATETIMADRWFAALSPLLQ